MGDARGRGFAIYEGFDASARAALFNRAFAAARSLYQKQLLNGHVSWGEAPGEIPTVLRRQRESREALIVRLRELGISVTISAADSGGEKATLRVESI